MKLCKMTTISRRFFCIRCCCEGNSFTSILTINPLIDMGLWALHNCYVYGSWDFFRTFVILYWEYSFTGSTLLLGVLIYCAWVLMYWEYSYTGSALILGVLLISESGSSLVLWELLYRAYSCSRSTLLLGVLFY